MEPRISEIIISCFAVYGFLILLHDLKLWCIRSAKRNSFKNKKTNK